jgi:hypothetical protein
MRKSVLLFIGCQVDINLSKNRDKLLLTLKTYKTNPRSGNRMGQKNAEKQKKQKC